MRISEKRLIVCLLLVAVVCLAVLLTGCATEQDTYRARLDALPCVLPVHSDEAVSIVTQLFASGDVRVHWVVGDGLRDAHDQPVAGVSIDSDAWVLWWGADNLSGASTDGPDIAYTAFAHELAHIALGLHTGDRDAEHTDPVWWGTGGMVERANDALIASGL